MSTLEDRRRSGEDKELTKKTPIYAQTGAGDVMNSILDVHPVLKREFDAPETQTPIGMRAVNQPATLFIGL